MHGDLLIHDVHRVLGPLPHEASPTPTRARLRADLDDLGVTSASAVRSWQLFGDPASTENPDEALSPTDALHDGVNLVPVVLPAAPGGGWPARVTELTDAGIRLVRACPARHRWSLDSPVAMQWWEHLAEADATVSLEWDEVGPAPVRALARAIPALSILVLGPGYRELRRCAELLDACPGVLIETGTLNTAGGVEWLAGVGGADRLVFGTGGPERDDAGATWLLRHLELPRDQVDLIAHGNAFGLLARSAPGVPGASGASGASA